MASLTMKSLDHKQLSHAPQFCMIATRGENRLSAVHGRAQSKAGLGRQSLFSATCSPSDRSVLLRSLKVALDDFRQRPPALALGGNPSPQ